MDTEEKLFYHYLARPNYRGVKTEDLVYTILDARNELKATIIDEAHKYFLEELIKGIEEEVARRRKIVYKHAPDREIIQTIKNSIDIADVIAWYTEVFTYKSQWTYRCTLHGADKNPSGVIYKDKQKFHCFGCGRHGDVFDAVMQWEGIDMPSAIRKLSRHLGIDLNPILNGKQNIPPSREDLDNIKGHLKNLEGRVYALEKRPVGRRYSSYI